MLEQPVTQPQPAPQVQSPAPAQATPAPAPVTAPAPTGTPATATPEDGFRRNYEGLANFVQATNPNLWDQFKQVKKTGEIPPPPVPTPQVTQPAPKSFLDMTEDEFGHVLEQRLSGTINQAVTQALTAREKQEQFNREKQEVAVYLSRSIAEAKLTQNDPLVQETLQQVAQWGIDVETAGGPSQFARVFTTQLENNILRKVVAGGAAGLSAQTAAQQAAANQVAQPAGPSAPSAVPMTDDQKLIASMAAGSSVNQRIFDEP